MPTGTPEPVNTTSFHTAPLELRHLSALIKVPIKFSLLHFFTFSKDSLV